MLNTCPEYCDFFDLISIHSFYFFARSFLLDSPLYLPTIAPHYKCLNLYNIRFLELCTVQVTENHHFYTRKTRARPVRDGLLIITLEIVIGKIEKKIVYTVKSKNYKIRTVVEGEREEEGNDFMSTDDVCRRIAMPRFTRTYKNIHIIK